MSETPTETPTETPAEPTPATAEEAPKPEAADETSDAAAAADAPAEEVVEVEEEVLEEVVEEVVVEVEPGTEGGAESSPAPPVPTEETTQPEAGDTGSAAPVDGAPAEEVVEIEEEVLEEVVEEVVEVEPSAEGDAESSPAPPADNDVGESGSTVGNSIEAPGSEDEAGDDADAETGDLASADHGDAVSEFKDEDTPVDSPQAASAEEDIELGNGVGGDVVEATGDGIMKPHKVGLHGQALEDQRRIKGLSVMCACVCIAALAVGLPIFIPFALDLPTIIEEN